MKNYKKGHSLQIREKMKTTKKILALALVFALALSTSLMVSAKTKTVTKSNDICTVKFEYDSFVDAKGIKKVRNGKVISTKGKSSWLFRWEFVPSKTTVKHIDAGRTYVVTVKGTMYHYHTPDFINTFDSVTKESKTTSFEFYYSK